MEIIVVNINNFYTVTFIYCHICDDSTEESYKLMETKFYEDYKWNMIFEHIILLGVLVYKLMLTRRDEA